MTADDVRARLLPCPFCGNAKMEIHHNTQANITFLLCGDDQGRGGCGAVVSFRPNLTGSKTIQAYNRRAAHADLSGEVRELVEAARGVERRLIPLLSGKLHDIDHADFVAFFAALAKFHPTHQEKP